MKIKAELTFPEKLKDEAIICNICKQYDIILSIVEASFSTDTGWAILVFDGAENEIRKALELLTAKGVKFEDTRQL